MAIAVRMVGVTKRFGSFLANDSVDLTVESGTIHAIVGENGAGKTTLMRVLYGLYRPDEGRVFVDDIERHFRSPREALAVGIGMVSQHYSVIPELTCLDNLMLGYEPSYVLHRSELAPRADELAQKLGFTFDWHALASTLSPAGCQKLEILKLLWRNAQVMILDEPTAMLSPEDGNALFANLRLLASEGKTILLVTHRLSEVMDNCKYVTVMREGKKVADAVVTETSASRIAELIVGEPLILKEIVHAQPLGDGLQVQDLHVSGDRGNEAVRGVSFYAAKGEVVGIAGVDGSGQRELVQAIYGLRNYRGRVSLGKRVWDTHVPTSQRIAEGLRIIPEDRREEGIILDWTVEENASLGLQRTSHTKERAFTSQVLERFGTKAPGLSSPIASLSGGNQQRFVAGRALYGKPTALLAFQPTRGLDIRGTEDVYTAIREECARGMAAIVVSFDLDEILQYCDRVLVMYDGIITEPPPHLAKDRAAIGRMMVGLSP